MRYYRRDRGLVSVRDLALPGLLVALLLAYATATAFVAYRQAWAIESFHTGVFAIITAACFIPEFRLFEPAGQRLRAVAFLCLAGIPAWGVVQLLLARTVSPAETRSAVLRWAALVAVFFLVRGIVFRSRVRHAFLDLFLWFATALAVLCVLQLFSSEGRVLWIFDTGYPEIYGTIPSRNHYAQFVELALPVALWRALYDRRRSFWYALAAGTLYASAIGSASRAGAILCTVELLLFLVVGLVRLRNDEEGSRAGAAILALVPAVGLVFTLVVGWERVWVRFQDQDPYFVRREFLTAAVEMAKTRPGMGYGLGTFPAVYQRYAIKDFPFWANQAHNDWAQFAAEGGVPFLLLVGIPFLGAIRSAVRHPWGLGLVAVLLHACVDYPFPREAISCWMFALLGALYAAQTEKTGYASSAQPAFRG